MKAATRFCFQKRSATVFAMVLFPDPTNPRSQNVVHPFGVVSMDHSEILRMRAIRVKGKQRGRCAVGMSTGFKSPSSIFVSKCNDQQSGADCHSPGLRT
jgi:hypothetical protein